MASWLATRGNPDSLLVLRDEDMMGNTARELSKIVAFLNVPADPERMAKAVRNSTAELLEKIEAAWGRLMRRLGYELLRSHTTAANPADFILSRVSQ